MSQDVEVILRRGVRRDGRDIPAGSRLSIPREEYEGAVARSPGIYVIVGSEPDPAAEAAKVKAARDEIDRADKLRRLEADRARKAAERERMASWVQQNQSREEAVKAQRAEAEALVAERQKAKRARASAQVASHPQV